MTKKRLGLFIDPIETLDVNKDTTCRLAAEAQKRGYEVFCFTSSGLLFDSGVVKAKGKYIHLTVAEEMQGTCDILKEEVLDLSLLDVMLVRKNPPVDDAYITATYLLELLEDKVIMINNPRAIRSCHSKLQTFRFGQYLIPTVLAFNKQDIVSFLEEHDDIIVKPVNGMGGKGVVRIQGKNPNLSSLLDTMMHAYGGQLIAQKYIPNADEGDKRVILFDGEVKGAILRTAQADDFRANLSAGASFVKSELSPREQEICETLKPYLKENGLFFCGLDIIGGYITEINATSPGALSWANQVYDTPFEKIFWDVFGQKYAT